MNALLQTKHRVPAGLGLERLNGRIRLAAPLALDQGAFNGCLGSQKYVSRVRLETQVGVKLGVNSTPTIFINGQRVGLTANRDPVETIRLAVQKARPR